MQQTIKLHKMPTLMVVFLFVKQMTNNLDTLPSYAL